MSQIATFFVPLVDEGREQEALNAFLRGHRVLAIEKAFAGHGWSFCVEWLEGSVPMSDWKAKRIDYRQILSPEVFARFAQLREQRKTIAQEEGVPPYLVMTDAQMAEAAKPEVLSLESLRSIEGFGQARLEKYGSRLLSLCENRRKQT